MSVSSFDHVAIPIQDVEKMLAFYDALGFTIDRSLSPRIFSAHLGEQKINFHDPSLWQNPRFELKGPKAVPGCGDFCFVWDDTEQSLLATLASLNLEIIEGPVERLGGRDKGSATGMSCYIRDPDGNLVELICYRES